MLPFLLIILLQTVDIATHGVRERAQRRLRVEPSEATYACPLNNDFYYNGVISSPNYPNMYPPSTKCYYYITAEPGKVLSFKFSQYDLETCCDYVTIYDGPSVNNKILAQFGGPKSNLTSPIGTYLTMTRNAVVTFQSNEVIQKSGFSFTYNSTLSATPCNRDVLLVINGMAAVGTQSNFQKQLQFIANKLTPTWQIGADKVRAMIALLTGINYSTIFGFEDMPTNSNLSQTVLSLTNKVPDVTQNNKTDLECLFRYTHDLLDKMWKKDFDRRDGIEQVAIVFVASNANSEQDFYKAMEFSHLTRTAEDTKIIIVGMGNSLEQQQISQLAYANGFAFFSGYDQLDSLVSSINDALCRGLNSQLVFSLFVRSLVVINSLHSVLLIIIAATQFLIWRLNQPCDALLSSTVCFAFRLPLMFCFLMSSLLHCGMSIERSLATVFKNNYADYTSTSGYFIISVMTCLGILFVVAALHKWPLGVPNIYCSGAPNEVLMDLSMVTATLGILELIAFIYMLGLFFVNLRQLKAQNYSNLQRKSQLTENVAAFKLILPLHIFHMIFFVSFHSVGAYLFKLKSMFSSETGFRGFVAAAYLIPLYTFLSPLIVHQILRRGAQMRKRRLTAVRHVEKNEKDVYFGMYQELWK
ncbi:unnamed protein product [Caenorhabditis auriculariae]|uniref:CUB domain-containing protein n=1 Tax=Caenorhabditis auriculariae TaxID=2777116 RepID=A0A8S1HCF1_9PELO|nr:unnamed protein product [Caenorhabditis auriculariae]